MKGKGETEGEGRGGRVPDKERGEVIESERNKGRRIGITSVKRKRWKNKIMEEQERDRKEKKKEKPHFTLPYLSLPNVCPRKKNNNNVENIVYVGTNQHDS